ncbi:MAG: DUF3095 family protein [Alphaproteobacteria bacterium]|nr:DUF3095 family protein [Alphaproteobacteria bacterium]
MGLPGCSIDPSSVSAQLLSASRRAGRWSDIATTLHPLRRRAADKLSLAKFCRLAQPDAIQTILNESQHAGIIDFGIHRADAALLTCFVQTTDDARHVHFVDGSNGGYAMAAQTLKDRLAATASTFGKAKVE